MEKGQDSHHASDSYANGEFRVQLGHKGNIDLLPLQERLNSLTAGMNPDITGTSLPANPPVFFGRQQILHEILSVLRRPDKPGV
ncbi:MAG: hypothetical protein PVG22_00975 [Chromatiales bacterium]|jgi:hypothetical protein